MWANSDYELRKGEDKKFTEFVSFPLTSFSTRCHRKTEVKDYLMNLEVKGKVSVLKGLDSASVKYNRNKVLSSKREVISLSCSVYARKGFLAIGKTPVVCSDKGMDLNVEGIELGLEEVLIVTMEYERDDSKTEETLEIKVRVLFFTISSKMENIYQSSSQRGFVRIDHYSSKTGEWKKSEFDADGYKDALKEVQQIEEDMYGIAKIVSETPNDKLSHLRFLVRPCAKHVKNFPLFIELRKAINQLQMQLTELKEAKNETTDKTEKLESLLLDLQSLTIEICSWKIIADFKKRQMQILRQ